LLGWKQKHMKLEPATRKMTSHAVNTKNWYKEETDM
jgi:hypothetical protein